MPRGDSSATQIRKAALELFFRHGVSGTSLRMVAESLGVTKAAIYHHYRTKEEIVRAVLEPAFTSFSQLVDAASALPAASQRSFLITGLAQQAVEHRELYAVTLQDVTAAELRRGTQDEQTFRRLRDLLAGPDPEEQSSVRAALFLSGLMAPAVDPGLAAVPADALESILIDAGHSLLALPAETDPQDVRR